MAKSLYITSLEPKNGKLVVMEMLYHLVGRVGFFWPITAIQAQHNRQDKR